jgi:hypothetical protein
MGRRPGLDGSRLRNSDTTVLMHRFFPIIFFSLSCAEPFDEDRHDLIGYRIAAVGMEAGAGDAMIWSGEGLYHRESPELIWRNLDGETIGVGFEVQITEFEQVILEVVAPNGESLQASYMPREKTQSIEFERYYVDYSLEELSVEDRISMPATAADLIPLERAARIRTEPAESVRVKWMSAFGWGTFLEFSSADTDFFPLTMRFNDGELQSHSEEESSRFSVLALSLDGLGSNAWSWIDIHYSDEPTVYFRHEGRLLYSDADLSGSEYIAATLVDSGDFGGVSLEDVEEVEDLAQQDLLACMPSLQSFRLQWVESGRCSLGDVIGARVVLSRW